MWPSLWSGRRRWARSPWPSCRPPLPSAAGTSSTMSQRKWWSPEGDCPIMFFFFCFVIVLNAPFKICAQMHFPVSSFGFVFSEFKINDIQRDDEHIEAEEDLQCYFFLTVCVCVHVAWSVWSPPAPPSRSLHGTAAGIYLVPSTSPFRWSPSCTRSPTSPTSPPCRPRSCSRPTPWPS